MAKKRIYYSEFKRALDAGVVMPVYLLTGAEAYLKERGAQNIVDKALRPDERSMNLESVYAQTDVSGREVAERASTLPFLSQRRVLVVRQCERWRAGDLEAIKTYCANPASSTVLILFSQDEKITTAAWREISGLVYHVECYPLFDNQIPAWIEHRAREYGKSIERLAVQRLMERVGQNLSELDNELAKCAEYVGPAMTIPEEAVREVTGIIRADTLREFNVALGKKDAAAAMQCANRLLAEGIKPPQILGALVYHIRQLLKHVMALEAGEDPESFLAHLRNPQARKELQLQIRNFALRDFDVIFRDLLQLDEWSKNGKPHWELYFQLFVLKLCGQPPLPSKTIAAGKRAR